MSKANESDAHVKAPQLGCRLREPGSGGDTLGWVQATDLLFLRRRACPAGVQQMTIP
jgi:hypothetical protein